jgi:hypothetical protein
MELVDVAEQLPSRPGQARRKCLPCNIQERTLTAISLPLHSTILYRRPRGGARHRQDATDTAVNQYLNEFPVPVIVLGKDRICSNAVRASASG